MSRSTILRGTAAAGLVVLLACDSERGAGDAGSGATNGVTRRAAHPPRFELGTPASAARIAAVDIDANASGIGLPPGRGTYANGRAIYARQCAMCHGVRGEGIAPFPQLVGAEPRDSFPFARDPKIPHTIGNYWPHATTLYDYIRRAMPFTAPGSLQPDEVYSLVAYLLAENDIVSRDAVIDAETLPKVRMPARERFVTDDRQGGPTFR